MSPSLAIPAHARYLRPSQVAEVCGVATKTVLRWIGKGLLAGALTPTKRYRLEPSDVVAFAEQHSYPVPRELREMAARVATLEARK
jgi:predicted site-specific integrase-resolvase